MRKAYEWHAVLKTTRRHPYAVRVVFVCYVSLPKGSQTKGTQKVYVTYASRQHAFRTTVPFYGLAFQGFVLESFTPTQQTNNILPLIIFSGSEHNSGSLRSLLRSPKGPALSKTSSEFSFLERPHEDLI